MKNHSFICTAFATFILSITLLPAISFAQVCTNPVPPCTPKNNGTQCVCSVGGGTQIGVCQSSICVGKSFSGGGQEGGAVDQGLKMLGDIVGKLMEKLAGGKSGGGDKLAETPADCSASTTNDWKLGRCQGTGVAGDILNSISNTQTQTPSNTSVTTSLLEGFADSVQNNLQVTNVTPVQSQDQSAQNVITSVAQNGFVSAPEPGSPSENVQNTAQLSGAAPQVPVSLGTQVQESSDGVAVTSGGVDQTTNTGISSFFGLFSPQRVAPEQTTLFGRLCAAKPWESSLVTRIFTASFFDALCEKRMESAQNTSVSINDNATSNTAVLRCSSVVQPGGEATIEWSCGTNVRSSGVGFNTNGASSGKVTGRPAATKEYRLECAQGGSRSCTIEVANPRVDLVAYPDRVQLGARSKLYWVSEGVEDCTVTGPGLNERGPKGAAVTGAILDATTFTAECVGANGATTTDAVIIDIGA